MKIAVCVKQVPDTGAGITLDPNDKTVNREGEGELNSLDEYAVEEALKIAEANSGEVVAVTMGPDQAVDAVRKALQMGADSGIHLSDESLKGSCAVATSAALAKLLEGRGFDLIVFGSESTDARMSVVPAMVAERLGLPQLTYANNVEVAGSDVKIHRVTDYGYDEVSASTPAVISVVEKINEPRYPSFKGIMAAKKKPVETVTVADLGIEAPAATSTVESFEDVPPRAAGTIVTDEGDGGVKIADYLSTQKLI